MSFTVSAPFYHSLNPQITNLLFSFTSSHFLFSMYHVWFMLLLLSPFCLFLLPLAHPTFCVPLFFLPSLCICVFSFSSSITHYIFCFYLHQSLQFCFLLLCSFSLSPSCLSHVTFLLLLFLISLFLLHMYNRGWEVRVGVINTKATPCLASLSGSGH